MDEFLQQFTQQLGVNQEAGKDLTGGLLNMIKQTASGSVFDDLTNQVPGASELAERKPQSTSGKGGLLGKVAGMLGGKAGAAMDLTNIAKTAGLDVGSIGKFVQMFLDFVRGKAGDDLANNLLSQVPALKKLMG